MNAGAVKSDTLTVILCNNINKHLNTKSRAIKIAKCCKIMRDRNADDDFTNNVFRSVIANTQKGNYVGVIQWVNNIEKKYREVYL